MSTQHDSRFDDEPEPRGRPIECTLCGSGAHNRSLCPWGAENYRMPPSKPQGSLWDVAVKRGASQDYAEAELRILAGMQNTSHKPLILEQSRTMQNAHPPYLEELSAHLDSQQAPKPAPQLGKLPNAAPFVLEREELAALCQPQPYAPSRLRRVWRAVKVVFGAHP